MLKVVATSINCRRCGESSLNLKVLVNESCQHGICIRCMEVAVAKGTCPVPGCDKVLDIRELNNLADPMKGILLQITSDSNILSLFWCSS